MNKKIWRRKDDSIRLITMGKKNNKQHKTNKPSTKTKIDAAGKRVKAERWARTKKNNEW